MVNLLNQIEASMWKRSNKVGRKIASSDLESDNKLLVEIKGVYNKYQDLAGTTICRMNQYITNNLEEFT
jgi:hypothetical protein